MKIPDHRPDNHRTILEKKPLCFPIDVTLDRLIVHTQHSGCYHEARAIRFGVVTGGDTLVVVAGELAGVDATIEFPSTRGRNWYLLRWQERAKWW